MKMIISPAKKMKVDEDAIPYRDLPQFLANTKEIKDYLQSLSYQELKDLWNTNDKITQQNVERLKEMDLTSRLTPAILAYEGIQYQYMAPTVFDEESFQYVEDNVRVLSAFYGVLKPLDGITPYRLEMQAKTKINGIKGLYHYWGDRLYQAIRDESGIIINLASKEYSKCIEKYLQPTDKMITCVFAEMVDGTLKQKATYAKMARGEMIRYLAENKIDSLKGVKNFNYLGYKYDEGLSNQEKYVFIK
ncbi:hypothetical protein SAMN05421767_11615 [Granulicatella balaenopterae]|uniref:UPF0246 protein SAMN05421767_11615 n=1 Tax=Granulicatella balaenopterae TaxID=137733 RepID=A0A1H9KYQ9_9LACT|nr:peroxide stress protein YaaA [Granulicatella balaenopterae]SER04045.1 hypothetical protein SAMN05421767_11615 [Granulicatella balaenopterae]